MDRNKSASCNRSQKKISGHHGSEFYALGTKGPRDERKRESTTAISSVAKKPKLIPMRIAGDVDAPSTSAAAATGGSGSHLNELWEQMASECESVDLVYTIQSALEQHDDETVLRLLCGCIRNLISSYARAKVDGLLYLALTYVAKMHPTLFCNDIVTSALVCVLRRENIKTRQSSYSHILAANLLARSYNDRQQWPEIFLRIYIEDAINERLWADNELCAPFIENLCAVFKTRTPVQSLLQLESGGVTPTLTQQGQHHQRETPVAEDDSADNSVHGSDSAIITRITEGSAESDTAYTIQNRYADNESSIEKYVTDVIKEQLNKRQQQDSHTRNFLKFLCSTSGLVDVRYICINRLELWIHNGKLVKFAQQLLAYICFNINGKCIEDHEVLATLVKMRLKTKPLINFYMNCIKEMIIHKPDILRIVLKLVVQNELSNTRNPNNMGMLATMFQTAPVESASNLADIYKELLLQRDDCLRTLRVFLRELVRMLRFDINIANFCKVFLSGRPDLNKQIEQSEFRDRIFQSMVDITCLCMLLTASPQVREAVASVRTNRDVSGNAVLLKFYSQMSQIQLDAVSWMYETVPGLFKLQNGFYSQALHKILLLENPEQYSRCDQWPSEPERATLLRTVSETPIHEEALLRIILIGITKDIPFTIQETIDIIMLVIKRASAMRFVNCPAVQVNKFDIIDFLFSMTEYHHPDNIKLPDDYDPPKLAISVLYWKAWIIMLMISAHNPSTFGTFCWEHYPTMKVLIEMCITNQFNENMAKEELQILPIEREHIIEFESYLAAQTSKAIITEENALLLSQLMLMDPMGAARRVPTVVLDQLKYLNKSLKLGHLLCRNRKPDLLLDIIQRQGTTQSMPWLSDLVQNSEEDFNHLPVQCLCEFLLFNSSSINEDNSRDAELVNFLRNLIMEPTSNKQTVCEVLDYIFRRLSSTVKHSRNAALGGIKLIFKSPENVDENDWLLKSLPQIPHFAVARAYIIPQLRAACQVENLPELVMAYIQFIAAYTINDSVTDMLDHIMDMAQLIVERSTMFQHIIPAPEDSPYQNENRFQTLKYLFVMFNNYMIKLREHHESYEWTEYPDLLMVQFDDGVQLPLHLNIIHAFIILLTHSSNTMSESIPILDYWFPPGRSGPNAYLPNIPHEPVQLLPDWIKLKMIRSSVDRLIEAALHGLQPEQIVLFVQNFGTPVKSMSKLLALLDRAVIEENDAVQVAILNKAYLAQLIEIQQARGAKNGHFTVQALGLHSHSQPSFDLSKLGHHILESINLSQFPAVQTDIQSNSTTDVAVTPQRNSMDTEEIIHNILTCPQLNEYNDYRFRRLIHQLLKRYGQTAEIREDFQDVVSKKALAYLRHIKAQNLYQNAAQKQNICTFLRALFKYSPLAADECCDLSPTAIENKKGKTTSHYYASMQSIYEKDRTVHSQQKPELLAIATTDKDALRRMLSQSRLMQCDTMANDKMKIGESLCRDGLLVDWLARVDPELVTVSKGVKISFLFFSECSDCRFYLLSLICHKTNWATLINTLNHLLSNFETGYDCSTVLNFIEALISNPKLWQGRDKSVSKTNQPEVVFCLNESELNVFSQFIMCEGESELNSTKYDFKLCSRINLLFRLTNRKRSSIVKFIEYVYHQNSCSQLLRMKVLQQVYLMYPSIKFIIQNQVGEHGNKLQSLKGCHADKVTNYLVTCLGNLLLKKDFEALSSDTELLMRKFAASHPALFLRQLGVMTSLIQGRAQLNLRTLREGYHLHRFIQLLRTLELLQPMLFDDAYKTEFHAAIECYITFLKHHSYVKEAYHILIKFVDLLQTYMNMNPTSALGLIEHHVGVLMELAAKFSTFSPLHQLVQGIALLQQNTIPSTELHEDDAKQEFDLDEQPDPQRSVVSTLTTSPNSVDVADVASNAVTVSQLDLNCKGAVSLAMTSSQSKSIQISPHFLNLIKVIKHSNVEDAILGPLQEIESLTSKRFSFLNELFDRLLELIFSPSAQIRSNAFILLIRHLKHNPGRSDINRCTLNAYIQCLRDDNSSVAATAVDNLAEMTLLLQEHSVEILTVAFSLGIRSRLYTCTQIKRVLHTLMLQNGY